VKNTLICKVVLVRSNWEILSNRKELKGLKERESVEKKELGRGRQ